MYTEEGRIMKDMLWRETLEEIRSVTALIICFDIPG
jgi:hypothetical protein